MQEYNKADRTLHVLSQILAKVNRTYIESRKDDSHTNLGYDHLGQRITGRWLKTANGTTMLSIRLSDLALVWQDDSAEELKVIPSVGRTIGEIEAETARVAEWLGLDAEGLTAPLHFDIPDHGTEQGKIPSLATAALREWTSYRDLANRAAHLVAEHLQTPDEPRIWPHHFDTGIYVQPNDRMGIGFGLAMEDSMAGAPYFYMAGYPLQGTFGYTDLPNLGAGKWVTSDGWNGAILTLPALNSAENGAEQALAVFLREAATRFLRG